MGLLDQFCVTYNAELTRAHLDAERNRDASRRRVNDGLYMAEKIIFWIGALSIGLNTIRFAVRVIMNAGSNARAFDRGELDNPYFKPEAMPTATGEPIDEWKEKMEA